MKRGTVCLSYIHDAEVAFSWHSSVLKLMMFDAQNNGRILEGGYAAVRCAKSSDLDYARNLAVKGFLSNEDTEWLFFIDTDMGFDADTVERLIQSADAEKRPIIGGLCFAQKEVAEDGMDGYHTMPRFTIMDWVDLGDGKGEKFVGRSSYPVNYITQCAGTGSACILIHRSVFEKIKEKYGEVWYNRIPSSDGTKLGEDLSFCVRAGSVGFPIFVDTSVKTTHLKNIWLNESDFWRAVTASPATEECAVIVPVMERPQNAEPFMRSLRASTGLAHVYAVAHEGDTETIDAWESAGATVVTSGTHSFASKVNVAYQDTRVDAPWMFVVGDDVKFHPGWLDHAQGMAGDRFHVIGTNDLGNPRVISGEHATHLLIRKSYVDEHGASWDGPKIVAHEGYHHNFVDDEVVIAAKQRGVWAMALGSIVEHLHPLWDKGSMDEVYARGQGWAKEDGKLFRSRLKRYSK